MAGKQNVIAFVWDFDKTLIPEYMQIPLFEYYKIDGKKWWDEVNHLPYEYKKQGAHHISKDTMYLNHILSSIENSVFPGLNNKLLRKLGAKLEFNKGIPEFFKLAKKYIDSNPLYKKYDITVEHYIVSTGFREMIMGSKVAPFVDGIWGNEFIEDVPRPGYMDKKKNPKTGKKVLKQLAYVLDNTSKTRALFEINKGINKLDEGDVNALLPQEDRRVPFTNMIYIADGPSDVPCFKIIGDNGGKTMVVYKPKSEINFVQGFELFREKRVQMIGEADYRIGTHTYMELIHALDEIAKRIVEENQPKQISITRTPWHIFQEEMQHNPSFDKDK